MKVDRIKILTLPSILKLTQSDRDIRCEAIKQDIIYVHDESEHSRFQRKQNNQDSPRHYSSKSSLTEILTTTEGQIKAMCEQFNFVERKLNAELIENVDSLFSKLHLIAGQIPLISINEAADKFKNLTLLNLMVKYQENIIKEMKSPVEGSGSSTKKQDKNTSSEYDEIIFTVAHREEKWLKELEDEGINIDVETKDKGTLLHICTPDIVPYLVKKGFDLEARDDYGSTPLLRATHNPDKTEALIKAKADIRAKDYLGLTPFDKAVIGRNEESTKLLLEAEVKLRVKLAKKGEYPQISPILQDHLDNAFGEASDRSWTRKIENLLIAGANIDAEAYGNISPLKGAFRKGDMEGAKYLIRQGADVNSGKRNLLFDVLESHNKKTTEWVQLLLDSGAKTSSTRAIGEALKTSNVTPEQFEIILDRSGLTPDERLEDWSFDPTMIGVAAFCNSPDKLKIILSKGGDVNKPSKSGVTPLHEAIKQISKHESENHQIMARMLLANGADPLISTEREKGIMSYIETIQDEGNKNIVESILIKHDAKKKIKNSRHEESLGM